MNLTAREWLTVLVLAAFCWAVIGAAVVAMLMLAAVVGP